MGQSTNGQICYGIMFEEGFEFPWMGEDGEADIEDWWIYQVLGFKHTKECYDESGTQLPGITDADTSAYFKERRDFSKVNPVPVELVNYCSGDCTMYILAVPNTVKVALRGYPEEFDPASLVVTKEQRAGLVTFCAQYGIVEPGAPKWYLSSLWN